MEPHKVNPPARWWYRLGAWDQARAQRRAREAVEQHGLGKVSKDTARLYDDLMIALRKPNAR